MMEASPKDHWEAVYTTTRDETDVSWFQDNPVPSLEMIEQARPNHDAAIIDIVGTPGDPHQGANVLVIIDEIPEGNWGARGETISLAMIADTVGLAKTSERFKWVRAYFDAKARARAAANYPPDTGGLLP